MKTPELETERLILRTLKAEDAGEIFRRWTGDREVNRYMNYSLHKSEEETAEWLRAEEENIEKDDNYTWGFVRKDTGELIGSGGICYNKDYGMFELGYNIMKKYWGQGYTVEASKRILKFAVDDLGESCFFGRHAKENPASGKVMVKTGFRYWRDGFYDTMDGVRFESREYRWRLDENSAE